MSYKNYTQDNFLASLSKEEDSPIKVPKEKNQFYFKLQKVFEIFCPEGEFSKAKDSSLKERKDKEISDSNFTYGEIVYYNI